MSSATERETAREAGADESLITAFSVYKSATALPMVQQRQRLPVYRHQKYQVVVVVGQTGSGKTTQIPQYLHEAGWTANHQMVACTQPRRVAATSVAQRVAQEMGVQLGGEVGYTIRFDDRSHPSTTRIKYMTDGMLFREMMVDPLLSKYAVIMIDEAHERSLYTDIVLGLLKKILRKRSELRIVVSSATLDAELFAGFFNTNTTDNVANDNVTIISLEGRMFPVDIHYLIHSCEDYVEKTVEIALQIHTQEDTGDILIFMTGREEIDYVVSQLKGQKAGGGPRGELRLMPVPVYAGLSQEEQMKCFDSTPRGYRKVVVATNIAEASITIDGIVYVIDCGFVKIRAYNPRTIMESLVIVPTSKASAQQRAGRAGRVRPGKVYRLYTQNAYETLLPDTSVPEMQRTNLAGMILQLKSLGVENVARFEYLTPPPSEMMVRALELLYSLGALDDHSRLTIPLGMRMSEMPVDPMLAKMLLAADEFQCVQEMLTIAAMLSVEVCQNLFISPPNRKHEADEQRLKFAVEEGDHITYLNVYVAFTKHKYSSQWCAQRYLNYKSLVQAVSIRRQLAKYLQRYSIAITSTAAGMDAEDMNTIDIRKCIVSGYFAHAALAQPDGSYRTIRDGSQLWMHPSSCLFKRAPKCVVFHEVVETNRPFMRDVTAVEQDWLLELAPHFYELKDTRTGYSK